MRTKVSQFPNVTNKGKGNGVPYFGSGRHSTRFSQVLKNWAKLKTEEPNSKNLIRVGEQFDFVWLAFAANLSQPSYLEQP